MSRARQASGQGHRIFDRVRGSLRISYSGSLDATHPQAAGSSSTQRFDDDLHEEAKVVYAMLQCSLQNLFRAGLILALLLSPERLTAQEPQVAQSPGAATEQPPAVPELADLIPLATALAGRLAGLEKTVADEGDLSRVEQQLGEISALVDEYGRELLALKGSFDPRAGRLPQLKAEIENAGDTLTVVSKYVTAKMRTFGNLRREWLAEQKQWNAWQAALLKDEPLEEITAIMTKAQGAIGTALSLLRQQIKPLLAKIGRAHV